MRDIIREERKHIIEIKIIKNGIKTGLNLFLYVKTQMTEKQYTIIKNSFQFKLEIKSS